MIDETHSPFITSVEPVVGKNRGGDHFLPAPNRMRPTVNSIKKIAAKPLHFISTKTYITAEDPFGLGKIGISESLEVAFEMFQK